MDHPLGEDTSVMSDEQLQEKISMLTKKYFQTRNPEAKSQINLMLDMYKLESRDRLLKKRANGSNNDLDKLISYRILLSEILIYEDLLNISDDLDIDLLSNQLSEVSATSKLNFEKLPDITEFNSHTLLMEETLKSAEDLHGRLIAALRNNETDVSNSLLIAINMNKEIEQNSFNDGLETFRINKTNLYNSLETLP